MSPRTCDIISLSLGLPSLISSDVSVNDNFAAVTWKSFINLVLEKKIRLVRSLIRVMVFMLILVSKM